MIVIVHKSCPALTVAPSSTSRFSITPLTGEGTGTEVLNNLRSKIILIYIDLIEYLSFFFFYYNL